MDLLGRLGVSKIEIVSFGNRGHVRKSRHHENDGFSVFPITTIEKLLVTSEAEYFYGVFSHIFP